MRKNKIFLILVGVLLFCSCFFLLNSNTLVNADPSPPVEEDIVMKFGKVGTLWRIDPLLAYSYSEFEVIVQVVETLLMENVSDPYLELIPCLAADFGEWSIDGLNYTIEIKENVKFHDDTTLDAYAVKWNFDRLAYFMNITGELTEMSEITPVDYVFRWDDRTPVINSTLVMNPMTIRFVLNQPFVALESLLSMVTGGGILSPSSTPSHAYLTMGDNLVGTGPFEWESADSTHINYYAFQNYHSGQANIDKLTCAYFETQLELENAFLSGNVDFNLGIIRSSLQNYFDNPNIEVLGGDQLLVWYLGMYNLNINKTMRQAMSHAIDYADLLNLWGGQDYYTRLKSPLPKTAKYSNLDYNIAELDIFTARQILVDAGICNFDVYNDAEWLLAASNNPIATYKYSSTYNPRLEQSGLLIAEDMEYIGVKIDLEYLTIGEFLSRFYNPEYQDLIELFILGWGMDYNDPTMLIDYLFESTSSENIYGVNDPYLDTLIEQGRTEINRVARQNIYYTIQQYLVEDLMPCGFLFSSNSYIAYNKNFTGLQWNPLGWVRFFDVSKIIEIDTPIGTDVELEDEYHALNLTFNDITNGGITTIISSKKGIDPEEGFGLAGEYYEIETTAEYTGTITVSLAYDEEEIFVEENDLQLMHWDEDLLVWVDITTYIDTVHNIIYGETESFSTFSIFQPDRRPPTTQISLLGEEGLDDWFSSNVYVILSAKDDLSKINKIEYSLDGLNWIVYTKTFLYDGSGISQIYYRSTDKSGNIEAIQTYEIKIDKSDPQSNAYFEGTLGNNDWFTSSVELTFDANDDLSGIDKIQYSYDGVQWVDYVDPEDVAQEGEHIIYYRSIDIAGNVEVTKSFSFKLDLSQPEVTVTLIGDEGGNNWFVSDVTVLLSATDSISRIDMLEYSIDGTTWIEYTGEFILFEEGTSQIYYRATDNAGWTYTDSTSISIDKTPPETELIITSGFTDEDEILYVMDESTFILAAVDDQSEVFASFYSINGGDWIEFYDIFDLTSYEYGTYVIEYYSIDIAGNNEAIKSTTVEYIEEAAEEYEGFGFLLADGDIHVGCATMTISDDLIEIEIDGVTVTWVITQTYEYQNIEIINGNGEIGWIRIVIVRCGDSAYMVALGKGVLFIGNST